MKLIIWIMLITLPASNSLAQIPEMVDGWPYKTWNSYWAVYSIPKFSLGNSEALPAITFGSCAAHEFDRFRLDGSFFPGWPFVEDTLLFGFPNVLADIDHDGIEEVVVTAFRRSYDNHFVRSELYIFDEDGSVFPGFPLFLNRCPTPNVADFDNDGEYDIMIVDYDNDTIFMVDRFGNIMPGWPVYLPGQLMSTVGSAGAVGDLDLDGYLEYIVKGRKEIYAYRYDGTIQDGFPIGIIDTAYFFNYWWSPNLADMDGDGYLEILISAHTRIDRYYIDSYVAIYEHNGTIKENWPLMLPNSYVWQIPTPADINNDGQMEIGFSAYEWLYFVDINGQNLPGWPAMTTYPDGSPRGISSELIIVDLNGDGYSEIFGDYNAIHADSMGEDSTWYWGHGYLYAHNYLGQELPGYPLTVEGAYLFRPPSFARDPVSHEIYMGLYTEIRVGLEPEPEIDTGYVEIYIFPDTTGPTDQWPMLSHDNLRTKNYNFVDLARVGIDREEILPTSCLLKQNYPNPFNNSTRIEFVLPKSQYVNLSVYDILGRRVSVPVDGLLSSGTHGVTIDQAGLSTGVYFYSLTSGRTEITRKMVLLR